MPNGKAAYAALIHAYTTTRMTAEDIHRIGVQEVTRIEKDAENAFARVVCRPAAGVDRGRFVLVLTDETVRPPPPEEQKSSKDKTRGGRLRDKDGSVR